MLVPCVAGSNPPSILEISSVMVTGGASDMSKVTDCDASRRRGEHPLQQELRIFDYSRFLPRNVVLSGSIYSHDFHSAAVSDLPPVMHCDSI